jgi:hypothetical protein
LGGSSLRGFLLKFWVEKALKDLFLADLADVAFLFVGYLYWICGA